MDHHSTAHIDTHMGNARRVIGADKEDQVARFCLGTGYRGADIVKPLSPQSPHIPPGMIDDPRHEPGAVKGGAG